ncbi:hypothetical protein ACFSUK_05110 [Sphingobium scionense]
MKAADFRLEDDGQGPALHAIGDWTALAMGDLAERLQAALGKRAPNGSTSPGSVISTPPGRSSCSAA